MHIELIAIPYDSGHRGLRMGAGPEHLLSAGLPERLREYGHTVHVTTIDVPDAWRAEIRTTFELTTLAARAVARAVGLGRFPLMLSGNCGPAAIGAVSGLGTRPVVFWFDAHGDFNTPETSVGGFLDGMGLATLAGRCWRELASRIPGFVPVAPQLITLLGTRDLDPLEATALAQSEVVWLSPADAPMLLGSRIGAIAGRARDAYIHVDLDVLDPTVGRVNSYSAPDGLLPEVVVEAIQTIGGSFDVAAGALTAYDPAVDENPRIVDAALTIALALVRAAGRPSVS